MSKNDTPTHLQRNVVIEFTTKGPKAVYAGPDDVAAQAAFDAATVATWLKRTLVGNGSRLIGLQDKGLSR